VRSTARLEWFLGSALLLLAAQLGFAAWQDHSLPTWKHSDDWRTVGPVAISPGWSVKLEERPIHPFLAEYDYRLQVFYSEDRYGEYRGTVDLVTNPGGRTFLCLYALTLADRGPLLEVADRMEASIVDLEALRRLPAAPDVYERRFVGAFVEEGVSRAGGPLLSSCSTPAWWAISSPLGPSHRPSTGSSAFRSPLPQWASGTRVALPAAPRPPRPNSQSPEHVHSR
jgi:hypothetical protein